jgi:4-hydroxy-4-methyl-2-oxoglutarate aldolase
MMRRMVVAIAFLSLPLYAQMSGFSKDDLLKYTRLNPFERFNDGRPKVPDELIKRLSSATTTSAWGVAQGSGYNNQFEGGWEILHPGKQLIGRAVTAVYMPRRPDVEDVIEEEAKAAGLGPGTTQRVIDFLRPGDVLVVDVMGDEVEDASFGGDNLATAIYGITGNGYVVNGSIRDVPGIALLNVPIFTRDYHPAGRDAMVAGINVPIRVGGVTVMPGDIVLGDRGGVAFIPPQLVRQVVERAELARLHDEWTKKMFMTGKYKATEIYSSPSDPALKKEYEEWLQKRKLEMGIE